MSHPKPRKPRPLGSLRQISKNSPEKLPTIPRLPVISTDTEKLKEGIHGNAMTVPPPSQPETARSRPPTDDRPKSDKKPPKSSGSSGSAVSHESCEKEIKDGLNREKDLKDQVSALQKQIAELKIALRGKENENTALQDRLETQEKEHESRLDEERADHDKTRTSLQGTREELGQAHERIGRMVGEHREELEALKTELEQQLKDAIASKDAEISDKDKKLSRLKSQMADALKGNSWERQQQLEELTKELSRMQEESDTLRMKIKALSKNKQGSCGNCEDSLSKVTKLQAQLKERDHTVRELKALCSKFESQLSTQDKLLEQWAVSHGHKITAPK
ncbi:myosin-9 [Aplysia californica]|uniref:Myosin-9 n=1 Tax=Aplysia californica TaxID=6500 RepID=A0ABM0JKZ6_APLCA|nr:myosin-9 [Aplysia californica]